jgi:hypothetical protein
MKENTRTDWFPGTVTEKPPFTSVIVPAVLPWTTTFTPAMGELSSAFLTVPVTLCSCANEKAQVKKVRKVA